MNLAKPVKQMKSRHRDRLGYVDKKYLGFVKQLPCAVCFHHGGFGMVPPSDAHHTICGRYSQSKSPDWDAIPLCKEHHQNSPIAIHEGRAEWVEAYGFDTDYIAWTRDMVERNFGYRPNKGSQS